MKNLQIFLKIILLSTILFSFSCATEIIRTDNLELITKNITDNRDMSQYDQGGHFICCHWDQPNDRTNISIEEKAVRDFIWKHWTEEKRGYIRLTYLGADMSFTTHYFIEPDNNGKWGVSWKYLYKHSMSEYNQPRKEGFGIPQQNESERRKNDWELSFKTLRGEDIDWIPKF